VKLSVNGGPFQSQSYTDEMIIQTHRIVLGLGAVIVRALAFTDCKASFGNFSLFDRALSLREVKSIYDLDQDLYGGGAIIIPPTRDRRVRPALSSGLTTDFNFNENTLISDVSGLSFDGVNYETNDGFVTLPYNFVLEVAETLPSYILQPNKNHLLVVQFRALTTSGVKMAFTTSPLSTASFSECTGIWLSISSDSVFAIYYKGAGVSLMSAHYIFQT
jgi:hypothetical protein